MDVRLLGPVEASVDGRAVAVGGAKPRALLAMLALNAGSTVSTDRLIEGLWGDPPPATATKLVQLYVSQLRKALAAGGDGAAIVTRGHGYELQVAPDAVDARRFERLVARGAPREALALWRGPALDDVADEPFAAAEIRRLEELRLAALELAIERDLDAGRHREVVGELEALVVAEPLRERLHAQRMLALYRCGQAGRRARGLPSGPGCAGRGDRRRAGTGAAAAARGDPAPGPCARRRRRPSRRSCRPSSTPRRQWRAARPSWSGCASTGGARMAAPAGSCWSAGARGIGKTRLAAELAGEVHRDGGAVLYASGAGPPDAALAALAGAKAPRRPALLVLDDVERAGNAVRAALDELADGLAALPLLVRGDGRGRRPHGRAARRPRRCASRRSTPQAVLAVARLYAGRRADAEIPVERLVEASGGVPQRVHRVARRVGARRAGAARRAPPPIVRRRTARPARSRGRPGRRRRRAAGAARARRARATTPRRSSSARSRGWPRSTWTTPASSSAASDSWPSWWRGWSVRR